MSDNLKQLNDNAKMGLENFRKTVETAAKELDFLPEESQVGANRLVDRSKSQLSEFEEEWHTLHQQQPASEDILGAFINRLATESGNLSILMERAIYRGNLGILEQQLALQQSALTPEALQMSLRPQIDFELEKIKMLENKKRLDPDEHKLLAIHRNNLQIYQEMLSGQRPYAPLHLVNSVTSQEQAIREIDARLASL
jgi:hypothetical protein